MLNAWLYIYTRKVLLPPFIHYHHDPILFSLCFMTNTLTSDSDATFVVIYGFLHLMSPRTMRQLNHNILMWPRSIRLTTMIKYGMSHMYELLYVIVLCFDVILKVQLYCGKMHIS